MLAKNRINKEAIENRNIERQKNKKLKTENILKYKLIKKRKSI